jgi:hypothetical protein
MKGLLFFLVLLGIGFIAWSVNKKEGFQDITPDGASPGLVIPIISPRHQTLTMGDVIPFTEPSTALLAPPPGQAASVNSKPSEDPALQKADAKRIQSVHESMMGFFQTDVPGLQKMGDASIQLPLATARSDFGRLRDELDVLKRNPGLESSLTQDDINGIEANLAYLQKKWRLSVNARSGAPSPMLPEEEEGFNDMPSGSAPGWFSSLFGTTKEGFQTTTSGEGTSGEGTSSEGTNKGTSSEGTSKGTSSEGTNKGTSGGGTNKGSGSDNSDAVTLRDLQDLALKLSIEMVRLGASGATDSNTQARTSVLKGIKQYIDDLIQDVKSGIRTISSVQLTKSDIAKFLPAITNPNSAISDITKDFGLQSVLSSLFPKYALGDKNGSEISKQLFNKYMKDITENLSWDVGLSYTGKAQQEVAANYASAMRDARYAVDTTGTPVASNSGVVANTTNSAARASSAYRGLFESVISSVTGQDAKVTIHGKDGSSTTTGDASPMNKGSSSIFDWQTRSTQICNQINARGLKAYDYGCMKSDDKVSTNFSWRGYTRMVCTRLSTMYDPSIPELCGCPPPTWIGWRP